MTIPTKIVFRYLTSLDLRAPLMRVKQTFEQEKYSRAHEDEQRHFHCRLPVYFRNQIRSCHIDRHTSRERQAGGYVMAKQRHGENARERCPPEDHRCPPSRCSTAAASQHHRTYRKAFWNLVQEHGEKNNPT